MPREYPAFASSVTSQLLVIHHRVVPVLVGNALIHTHKHTKNRVVPKASHGADTHRLPQIHLINLDAADKGNSCRNEFMCGCEEALWF